MNLCETCSKRMRTQAFSTKDCKGCEKEFTATCGGINYCNICTVELRCSDCFKPLDRK